MDKNSICSSYSVHVPSLMEIQRLVRIKWYCWCKNVQILLMKQYNTLQISIKKSASFGTLDSILYLSQFYLKWLTKTNYGKQIFQMKLSV